MKAPEFNAFNRQWQSGRKHYNSKHQKPTCFLQTSASLEICFGTNKKIPCARLHAGESEKERRTRTTQQTLSRHRPEELGPPWSFWKTSLVPDDARPPIPASVSDSF